MTLPPKSPIFIPIRKALELHERQIRLYGGDPGIRDLGLLESALAMAQSGLGDRYFHTFPFEMAAAYLFHIVRNHPFVDGNKRTGAVVALVFLSLNGVVVDMPEEDFERFVRDVATGKMLKPEIASLLKKHSPMH